MAVLCILLSTISLYSASAACSPPNSVTPTGINTVLYVEGVFDLSYSVPEMIADAKEIASSGFTTVILAFLHYHPRECIGQGLDGLLYNNVCFSNSTVKSTLTSVLEILRDPKKSSVKHILLSIGGAGCQSDFDAIQKDWTTFAPSLTTLFSTFTLDGIDLDLEVRVEPYLPVLKQLVHWGVNENVFVTAVPAEADNGWLSLVNSTKYARNSTSDKAAVAAVEEEEEGGGGAPGVSWLNLQTYGGDSGWVKNWANHLKNIVPNSDHYCFPGGSASTGYGPSDMAQLIRSIKSPSGENTNITGAFVWDYRMIKYFSGNGPSSNVTLWNMKMENALVAV